MKDNCPVVWINVFSVKAGKLDEFIAIQSKELNLFKKEDIPGWISSYLYQSMDEDKAIMITTFESVEAHKNWLKKNDFSKHLSKIEHLIEDADGGYYTLMESVGKGN